MKKFLFALAGVAALAVASASAPASAMPAVQGGLAGTMNNVNQVQWHHPHHRGWGHPNHGHWGPRHQRCWNERVRRHDRWGRPYWTTRRVCR